MPNDAIVIEIVGASCITNEQLVIELSEKIIPESNNLKDDIRQFVELSRIIEYLVKRRTKLNIAL